MPRNMKLLPFIVFEQYPEQDFQGEGQSFKVNGQNIS